MSICVLPKLAHEPLAHDTGISAEASSLRMKQVFILHCSLYLSLQVIEGVAFVVLVPGKSLLPPAPAAAGGGDRLLGLAALAPYPLSLF